MKRWTKRRLYAAGIAMALGLGTLAGATSGASAHVKATAADVVTLNLESVNTVQNAWEAVIPDFEAKYPDIHINATYLNSATSSALLAAQIQAGNAPDVYSASAGTGTSTSIWPLAANGKLLALTGTPLVKELPKSGVLPHSYKGQVYGFPMAVSTNGIFYNTTLFKQLKLKVPTTLSQVYTLCKTIKADGKIPIALGFAGNTTNIGVMLLQLENEFVYGQNRNWVVDRESSTSRVTFANTPGWRALFQFVFNLSSDGCFGTDPAGISYPTGAGNLVASGQAVMEFLSGGTINSVTSINPNIPYAMFEVPPDNSGKHTVASIGYNLSVAANALTKYPAQVKTFLDFVGGPDDAKWALNAASISPENLTKGIFPSYLAASDAPLAKKGRLSLNQGILLPYPTVNTALNNDLEGIITGQQTVSGALTDLDDAWNAAAAAANN